MWPDLNRSEDAYLLGLLQTDGTNYAGTGRKGRISLELSVRDELILQAIRRCVPYPSTITYRTRATNFASSSSTAVWNLCALEARLALIAAGLPVGRKSREISPPKAPFAVADYVRGLVDGDGSLGRTSRGWPFISFVTASEQLAQFYVRTLLDVTGARRNPARNRRDDIFNILVTNDPAVAWARWLYYADNVMAIPRKLGAAQAMLDWERPAEMRARPRCGHRRWTSDEDRLVASLSIKEAAAALQRTEQSVNLRRWRLRAAARDAHE